MSTKEYYVYAKCSGGGGYLQIEFIGTRSQCQTFIKNKVRHNQPTHYNFISCLGVNDATRRYL